MQKCNEAMFFDDFMGKSLDCRLKVRRDGAAEMR